MFLKLVGMYKISTELVFEKMDDRTRERKAQELKNFRTTDDIVAYLFALQESETFQSDENILHSAFYELKEEFPDFFEEFIFTRGDIYPFSKELENIFFRLQQSGILEIMNPSYEKFIFKQSSKKIVLEHISDRFNEAEKIRLEEMGRRLGELL